MFSWPWKVIASTHCGAIRYADATRLLKEVKIKKFSFFFFVCHKHKFDGDYVVLSIVLVFYLYIKCGFFYTTVVRSIKKKYCYENGLVFIFHEIGRAMTDYMIQNVLSWDSFQNNLQSWHYLWASLPNAWHLPRLNMNRHQAQRTIVATGTSTFEEESNPCFSFIYIFILI